jgi:hypothetical protein
LLGVTDLWVSLTPLSKREMPMSSDAALTIGRYGGRTLILAATLWACAGATAIASTQYAQYPPAGSYPPAQYPPPGYAPPPSGQYPPPGYSPPPCEAVTPGPVRGAGRGAAGGAVLGAIGGNAGRGAAIGAAVGGVGGAIRRGSARAGGACY